MQTTIKLQEPFRYSIVPLVMVLASIIAITCYWFYLKKKKEKNTILKQEIKVIPEKNRKDIPEIKRKYLKQLDSIENKYEEEKIELRKAYQEISEAVRFFVFEVTDITTQNYSLSEIKKLNIPHLYELIEEYYEPEFSYKSIGDFKNSIHKARRVINEWN